MTGFDLNSCLFCVVLWCFFFFSFSSLPLDPLSLSLYSFSAINLVCTQVAVANADCRMVALLFKFEASPAHNVFDGIWVVDGNSADEFMLQPGFDGTHPNRTFEGLHALLPRIGQPRGVGIAPLTCLLDSLQMLMMPLPSWSHSYKLPSIPQCSRFLQRREQFERVLQGAPANCAAAERCSGWLPLKPPCRHTAVAVTTLLAVTRLLERDFCSNCPHIAARIAIHAFDNEIWKIVAGIADGTDHCY